MILEKLKLKDGLKLEIVNKDDIMLSYKNHKLVSSCMSSKGRWKYTKLYNYVKDLKLLRIMHKDILVLRALLWNVFDTDGKFKFLDSVYYKNYCDGEHSWGYYCSRCLRPVAHPSAYEQFKEIWPKFADVRNTNKRIYAEVLPNKVKIWPYMDTLEFYNPASRLLSNKSDWVDYESDGFTEYGYLFTNALDHV